MWYLAESRLDSSTTFYYFQLPYAGSGTRAPCGLMIERIDPLRFLAGCRTRRLNQV